MKPQKREFEVSEQKQVKTVKLVTKDVRNSVLGFDEKVTDNFVK